MKIKTKQLTQMAVLAAVSMLLVFSLHIPFPPLPWLEYDLADVAILIGTFMFGPLGGLLITGVVSFLQGTLISTTGLPGALMHFIATGSFVLVAGNIYKRNRTRKGAAIGLSLGVLTMTVTMAIANIILTPIIYGAPREFIIDNIGWIVLFNFTKAGLNAIITFVVYKPISKVLGMELKEAKIAESK